MNRSWLGLRHDGTPVRLDRAGRWHGVLKAAGRAVLPPHLNHLGSFAFLVLGLRYCRSAPRFAGSVCGPPPTGTPYTSERFSWVTADCSWARRMRAIFEAPDRLLASGYLWEENRRQMAYKPLVIAQPLGRGIVIGFTADPNFRGHLDGLNVLFLNAVFRSVRR